MQVDLDKFELGWLLDSCLRGSHLRSGTIERFVDEWFDKMPEEWRMSLFEWSVRLTYSWAGHNCFEPQSACCGKDIIFMKRYHPGNQYMVTLKNGKKEETVRAFKMDGQYYVKCNRRCAEEFITKVEKLELPDWEKYKVDGVDYDKNILEREDDHESDESDE